MGRRGDRHVECVGMYESVRVANDRDMALPEQKIAALQTRDG
jgi:hypothetical protein